MDAANSWTLGRGRSPRAPFLRKVVISRKIENSRQIDGNPDSLLKFLSACRHEERAVDFLGCLFGCQTKDCPQIWGQSCSKYLVDRKRFLFAGLSLQEPVTVTFVALHIQTVKHFQTQTTHFQTSPEHGLADLDPQSH